MAKTRLVINPGAVEKLLQDAKIKADLERRAQSVVSAANAQSSWGGYFSEVESTDDGPVARVWNIKSGASDDESRNQRIIRNLDAGR